jgi:Large-conductance mechanosensitive channel, MscL
LSPVIGAVAGGFDFSNYFIPLSSKVTADSLVEAKKQGAVLAWGNFVTVIINFIIIALDLVPCGQADESYAAVGAGDHAGIDEAGNAAHGNSRSAQARAK